MMMQVSQVKKSSWLNDFNFSIQINDPTLILETATLAGAHNINNATNENK